MECGWTQEFAHDTQRAWFIRESLKNIHRAIGEGVDIRGYLHWSLMDNFEWADGYTQRYGLTYVDFRSQRRTVKDSARWYGRVAATGRLDS